MNSEVLDYVKKSFDLKNQGYYKPAIEMLYKALTIDSDNLEILAQLAHLYKLMGNSERSIYYIEKVLEHDFKHLDCLRLLVEIYESQQDYKKAQEVAAKIFEIEPNSKNLAQKIKICTFLNEFDKIQELQKNEEFHDEEVLYELACSYFRKENIEQACSLLSKAIDKNPNHEKSLLLLAKLKYDKGEFDKSKALFKTLSKISQSAEVLNYLGLFELNAQKHSKAIEYFQKALGLDSQNSQYAYNLASAYFMQGWSDEALKYFTLAISISPSNIDYHFSLAYFYYQLQMFEKAKLELQFIKTLDENHTQANVLEAVLLAKSGDLLQSKNILESMLNRNSNDDFVVVSLARIYKDLGQKEKALTILDKFLQEYPNSIICLSELVELEFDNQNFERAKELAQKILEKNKKYLQGHVVLAKIYYEQKDFQNMFNEAQEIIELDSNCAQGYYFNSLCLFEQKDVNFAIESLKKAISLDLNNASLYIKMSEFYQELGDFKMAYDWAKESSEVDEKSYKNKWLCAQLAGQLGLVDEATKFYSQSYRMALFDNNLVLDYTSYLSAVGKEKQAQMILKNHELGGLINKK